MVSPCPTVLPRIELLIFLIEMLTGQYLNINNISQHEVIGELIDQLIGSP